MSGDLGLEDLLNLTSADIIADARGEARPEKVESIWSITQITGWEGKGFSDDDLQAEISKLSAEEKAKATQ
jgi:hypothetical protein